MALARIRRFETWLVLTTMAFCAFFLSQGVTALNADMLWRTADKFRLAVKRYGQTLALDYNVD